MPRTVTLMFDDGSKAMYQNVPDTVTPDQVEARAAVDYAGRRLTEIRGSKSAGAPLGPEGIPLGVPGVSAPPAPVQQPQQPESIGDKLIGTAEAGLTALTGATGGQLGMIGGTLKGLAAQILSGQFGTPQAANLIEQQAMQGAQALTYAPRTQSGQVQAQALGETMQQVIPVAAVLPGMAPATSGLSRSARPTLPVAARAGAEGVARDVTSAVVAPAEAAGIVPTGSAVARGEAAAGGMSRAIDTAGAAADRAAAALKQQRQSAQGSVGAAGTSIANQARGTVANASPALQAVVDAAVKRGDQLDMQALSRHAEAESLPVPVRLTEGQATGSLEKISNERNMRAKNPAYAEHFNAQDTKLKENLSAIREAATPDVYTQDSASHADAIIGAYKAKDDAARADIRAKYQTLANANGGMLPIDSGAFVANAEAGLQKANRSRFVPPEVRGILDDYKSGAQMTFDDFEQLRTILSAEARKADRAGDGNRAMAVSAVRNALEDLPMPPGREDLKQLADAARSAAKSRFDAIKADPAYAAVVKDKALPDSFGNRFIVHTDTTNVSKMFGNLSADNVAQQTIAAILFDHLAERAGVKNGAGAFSQAGFGKAFDKQAAKLARVMPQDQVNKLAALNNVARYVKEQPHGSWVNNSNTFVSQAGSKAAGTLEGAANYAAGGVPVGTWARGAIENRFGAASFSRSTLPGAGIVKTKQQKRADVKAKVDAARAAKNAKNDKLIKD